MPFTELSVGGEVYSPLTEITGDSLIREEAQARCKCWPYRSWKLDLRFCMSLQLYFCPLVSHVAYGVFWQLHTGKTSLLMSVAVWQSSAELAVRVKRWQRREMLLQMGAEVCWQGWAQEEAHTLPGLTLHLQHLLAKDWMSPILHYFLKAAEWGRWLS